jgi:hypothetical protein
VKRIIFLIIILAVIGSGGFWLGKRSGAGKPAEEKPAAEKPADDEPSGIHITREENGKVVLNIDDETQGNIGLKVAHPAAVELAPESEGHGRVLDAAPLVALLTELASSQAAYAVSSNELVRLKTLAGQGNASARALQAAEAAAQHDQLAVQSAKDRLALGWGKDLENQNDVPAFIQALTSLEMVLVRVDLPAGEIMKTPPVGARIVTLSSNSAQAEYVGPASNVDPQIQGQGFVFIVKANAGRLSPGATVTGHIAAAGESVAGVVIPSEAVVRTEDAGWIYVLQGNAEDFVRTKIPLDHATEGGWFVRTGVTATDYLVVTGAQMLLSEELKGTAKPD